MPYMFRKGEVQASILIIDEIESLLNSIIDQGAAKTITLNVHPFIDVFALRIPKAMVFEV